VSMRYCVLRARELDALVAITLAVALAFILITPDSSDDVDAVLHLVKASHSHTFTHVLALPIVPIVRVKCLLFAAAGSIVMLHVPELLCTYRC
jgi:hypothetical protein